MAGLMGSKRRMFAVAAIGLVVLALSAAANTSAASAARLYMSCGYPPVYSASFDDYFDGHIEYRRHPRRCDWSENGTTAYQIILVKIRWKGWGSPRAHARALRVDNHDMDRNGFQRHPVRITLFAPRPAFGHPGKRRLYYTRLRIVDRGFVGVEKLFRPGEPPVEIPEYSGQARRRELGSCPEVVIRNQDGSVYTETDHLAASGVSCRVARAVAHRVLVDDGEPSVKPRGFECDRRPSGVVCRRGGKLVRWRYGS